MIFRLKSKSDVKKNNKKTFARIT